jgi:DNA-binding MarR family transcriptional regulator
LSALLSRVLLAFAIEFERESDISLVISANVVRVLDDEGVRIRDLPLLTGVSKEAISMAVSFLQKGGFAIVGPDEAESSRWKVARLTRKGRKAQDTYHQLSGSIDQRWQARFGEQNMTALRDSLVRLAGEAATQPSPLFRGLEPYPDGWRASVRKPRILPHFPMVLHRGGFPDGS